MKKIYLRKNLTALTDTERTALVNALLQLANNGQYAKYANQHETYFGDAHGNEFFFPWHRKFLSLLEKELQAIDSSIALPYWDSTSEQSVSTLPWTSAFMGGTGNPVSGPFSGWGIRRSLGAFSSLPDAQDITNNQALTPYSSFWSPAEGTHGPPHNWVGGNMTTVRSPEDPIFFLHHCYVDKWWSDWQLAHPLEARYQGSGSRSPTSAMPPWSTTPNDVLDTVDLDYIYDTDPPRVTRKTSSLNFVDIPEGEETVRGVTFDVITNTPLSFNITVGPGADFGTPFGVSESVDPGNGAVRGEVIVWISFKGTTAGALTSGSVTIECPQTGDVWVVPINANTVNRPTVGVALVLDKSGSMRDDIGDGRSRNDLLVFAANIFANVIQPTNGLGIAAFDHDANKVMDIKDAGPPISELTFGTGRTEAIGHILAHAPNPNGFTSIGDGVEVGSQLTTAAASNYDEMAMLVFTDGKENRSKYIADVSSLIGDRVFAIGLGTADELNAAALGDLCNSSGGELYLTDTIDPNDDYFKLAKYYLQVLAGITNTDIVTDPEDWIHPGQKHRHEFKLNETDISHDVVLLCPAANVVRMTLETPSGEIIDPAFAGGAVGVSYVPGESFSYYRMTLPVVGPGGTAAREGTWAAILEVDPAYFKRYLASLDNHPELLAQVQAHGVRYNLSIYALSNLRLRGTLQQNSYEPGARLTLRCHLTEYGLPLFGTATLTAELRNPDGTSTLLAIPEVEKGVYELEKTANLSGIYTFQVRADGKTARGRDFTRERLFTAAVWKGGDDPAPTTPTPVTDDERQLKCACNLWRCLLSSRVITPRFERRLAELGIDINEARRCVEAWCRCAAGRTHSSPPTIKFDPSRFARAIEAEPGLLSSLGVILGALADSTDSADEQ